MNAFNRPPFNGDVAIDSINRALDALERSRPAKPAAPSAEPQPAPIPSAIITRADDCVVITSKPAGEARNMTSDQEVKPTLDIQPALIATAHSPLPRHHYTLLHHFEVAGRQGVATDGHTLWVSGSTSLYRYTTDGQLLQACTDCLEGISSNHLGDIDVFEGRLYAGGEEFLDGEARGIEVLVYDAQNLKLLNRIPFESSSGQVEVSGLCVNPVDRSIWMSSWVGEESGRHLYQYDLDTGAYRRKVHMQPVPQWVQGICVFKGEIYLTADDGCADDGECDHLYRVDVHPERTNARVVFEHEFHEFGRVGEIEGVGFTPDGTRMLVHANRGRQIVLGMPKTFYDGYDREIHEVYVYSAKPYRMESALS